MYQYPRGAGGIALLCLRASLCLLLLATGQGEALLFEPSALTFCVTAVCVGLLLGFLAPLLGITTLVGEITCLILFPADRSLVTIVAIALAVTITLLGAGAYSIDGVLFGTRRVIL